MQFKNYEQVTVTQLCIHHLSKICYPTLIQNQPKVGRDETTTLQIFTALFLSKETKDFRQLLKLDHAVRETNS